jgi:hypothetical protein
MLKIRYENVSASLEIVDIVRLDLFCRVDRGLL